MPALAAIVPPFHRKLFVSLRPHENARERLMFLCGGRRDRRDERHAGQHDDCGRAPRVDGSLCGRTRWEQFHSPKNLAMALAAEAAELMEHFLWIDNDARAALVRDLRSSRRSPRKSPTWPE